MAKMIKSLNDSSLYCYCLQEHLHFVTEISQDEIFILDPELVATQSAGTPPGMPDLVVEQASG